MRFIILTVGYNNVAVPYSSGAELAPILAALADARNVNSVGYGDDQKWVPISNEPVQVSLVDGSRVTIGNDLETLRAQLTAAQAEAKTNSDRWLTYYNKSQELEKKLKEANIPPPPASPAADDVSF